MSQCEAIKEDIHPTATVVAWPQVRLSNCYIFALTQWATRGGYVVLRRSRYGWWPHAFWSPDLVSLFDFKPTKFYADDYRAWLPPVLFRGFVRESRMKEGA